MANLSHDPAHQSFDATDPHSAEHGHGGSIRTYVMVALALVFLTACSYWTYTPFWPFGDNLAMDAQITIDDAGIESFEEILFINNILSSH